MSKPSWGDAPEWASHFAQDGDGKWYWYEESPKWESSSNQWVTNGRYKEALIEYGNGTLESRP